MLWYVLCLAALVASVAGHGRVIRPPSRASMWRFGFSTPHNYDDDGLNCGGFYHQYSVNGGKCGVCGDPYDMPEPRAHELGGRFGSGRIVANYEQGQVFTATVELSAYHKGYWEFRICTDPRNNSQTCFDQHLLQLEDGGTKYYPWKDGTYSMNYRLPEKLVCNHCVLQWRYIAGNNWGNCKDGTEGLGCGNQENFGACTDISIGVSGGVPEDIPIEIGPNPIPACIDTSSQAILELIRKIAVRPRLSPVRNTSVVYQRKNQKRKPRKHNVKPRKRKKTLWNFTM